MRRGRGKIDQQHPIKGERVDDKTSKKNHFFSGGEKKRGTGQEKHHESRLKKGTRDLKRNQIDKEDEEGLQHNSPGMGIQKRENSS